MARKISEDITTLRAKPRKAVKAAPKPRKAVKAAPKPRKAVKAAPKPRKAVKAAPKLSTRIDPAIARDIKAKLSGLDWIEKTDEAFGIMRENEAIDDFGNADAWYYIPIDNAGELQDWLDKMPGGMVRLGLGAKPTKEETDGTDEQIDDDGYVRRWTRSVSVDIGSVLLGALFNPDGLLERMADYYNQIEKTVIVHVRRYGEIEDN